LAEFKDVPLAWAKMRMLAYIDIFDNAENKTEKMKALEGIREEMRAINLPQAAHGTIKEALEFINRLVPFVSSRQGDMGEVQ
jgi:hypothetical protein